MKLLELFLLINCICCHPEPTGVYMYVKTRRVENVPLYPVEEYVREGELGSPKGTSMWVRSWLPSCLYWLPLWALSSPLGQSLTLQAFYTQTSFLWAKDRLTLGNRNSDIARPSNVWETHVNPFQAEGSIQPGLWPETQAENNILCGIPTGRKYW